MKKYIILILAALVVSHAYSQEEDKVDDQTAKKLTKEQRIEKRQAQEAATKQLVDTLIAQRKFVIEADYLSNQSGRRVIVNSNLNFIVIDSSKITLQIASLSGIGGANGLGGITTDGTISGFKVTKTGKTKTNYLIRLFTMTTIGNYDIFLNISPFGTASATISGSTYGKLNYHGRIVPIGKSKRYKGMTI